MIPKVMVSTGNVEHYTPRYVWSRALDCLGTIDLDPASDGVNIPAEKHFTRADDGLSKQWFGNIWLNPPFGPGVDLWFEKLRDEHRSGRVRSAVVLWKSATETRGWQILIGMSSRVCFPYKRIPFLGPQNKGANKGPAFSPALFYIGRNPANFEDAFKDIGDVWSTPRADRILDCEMLPQGLSQFLGEDVNAKP